MTDTNEQFFTPDYQYGFVNSDYIFYDYAAKKLNKYKYRK